MIWLVVLKKSSIDYAFLNAQKFQINWTDLLKNNLKEYIYLISTKYNTELFNSKYVVYVKILPKDFNLLTTEFQNIITHINSNSDGIQHGSVLFNKTSIPHPTTIAQLNANGLKQDIFFYSTSHNNSNTKNIELNHSSQINFLNDSKLGYISGAISSNTVTIVPDKNNSSELTKTSQILSLIYEDTMTNIFFKNNQLIKKKTFFNENLLYILVNQNSHNIFLKNLYFNIIKSNEIDDYTLSQIKQECSLELKMAENIKTTNLIKTININKIHNIKYNLYITTWYRQKSILNTISSQLQENKEIEEL